MIAHLIYTWTGVGGNGQANTAYSFWSGIGGFSTIVVVIYHRTICHARHCWRPGKYEVDKTPYKVCAKHHSDVPNHGATVAQIHKAHAERTRR